MNFWIPIDYIIKNLVDPLLAFLLGVRKGAEAKIVQTIDNRKKKGVINIQIGGKKEIYHIYERYEPSKERLEDKVRKSNSIDSTAVTDMLEDDDQIEETVNQYLETQINE
ncbi:hypothetical protein KW786_03950 [Candidatus Parcubacteria bacterium]|nr:hypothetical protein [Candidatus Parcubacteria bacterium]